MALLLLKILCSVLGLWIIYNSIFPFCLVVMGMNLLGGLIHPHHLVENVLVFLVVLLQLLLGVFLLGVCVKDIQKKGNDENDLNDDAPLEGPKREDHVGGLHTSAALGKGGWIDLGGVYVVGRVSVVVAAIGNGNAGKDNDRV